MNYRIERVKDEYQAVRLAGYTNTWSAFEKLITEDGREYIIFENDVWGDETFCVVMGRYIEGTYPFEPICETYDDIVTALEDEGII